MFIVTGLPGTAKRVKFVDITETSVLITSPV